MNRIALGILLAALLQVVAVGQAVVFVDQSATGANDGTSWTDAYVDLMDALQLAGPGSEVWVAQGTYRPDSTAPFDRSRSFELPSGLRLYGSFAGHESDLSERLPGAMTVLSGDLLGNDGPNFSQRDDNSYHVLRVEGAASPFVIDGFSIRGGEARSVVGSGGGLQVIGSTGVVQNCLVQDCAAFRGGGVLVSGPSSLELVNAVVVSNLALDDGGGLVTEDFEFGSLVARSSTFWGNVASGGPNSDGGGAFASNLNVLNSIFWGNVSDDGTLQDQQLSSGGPGFWAASCVIQGLVSLPGEGNIGIDPLLLDPLGADGIPATGDENFGLGPGSPAIDTGDVELLTADDWDMDGDGNTIERTPLDVVGVPRVIDVLTSAGGDFENPVVDRGALEAAPAEYRAYGNGINPAGSLVPTTAPFRGTTFSFDVHNPEGTQVPPAFIYLLISARPLDGVILPNWGMVDGSPGELLVDLSPGISLIRLAAESWSGAPTEVSLLLDVHPRFVGLPLFLQCVLVAPFGKKLGLTEAIEIRIGA